MSRKRGAYFHYVGAMHMHTTESDGTRTLEEVVSIGQHVGLDFMMFTDHMDLTNRDNGGEGIYGNTLVVIGYEHNDPEDNHHYMIFGSPGVYDRAMSAGEYVAAAASDGAVGIIAHPDERRSRDGRYPPYPWIDWSVEGFTGIELWNQMSEWMEKLNRWNRIAMALSPRKSMTGPTAKTLRIWDEVNMKRKVVGIVGVDAHAFPIKLGPFTVEIFPYKVHFKSLRTHVLLRETISTDFKAASDQLYDALKDCRVFGSNMRWGVADKFEFMAESGTETAICGGELSSVDGSRLFVKSPARATIRLVRNGEYILEAETNEVEYTVQTRGVYRVEVWKGDRGWIFSNHLRIGEQN
jgi:hypothetical protein